MSFLKIKDSSKRDALVSKYIKTKNKIQNDFRSERLGEQSLHEDFEKIFKPITEQQQKSFGDIVSELDEQPEALAVAPAEPTLPINVGRIAENYLRASHGKDGDHTYGLKDKDRQFFVDDAEVDVVGNDLIILTRKGIVGPVVLGNLLQ